TATRAPWSRKYLAVARPRPRAAPVTRTTRSANARMEPTGVDAVGAHFVVEDALGRIEQSRRLRAVAAGALEGVLNQVLLVGDDGVLERDARHSARDRKSTRLNS